jgi:ribose transport system permease protein
MRQISVLLIVAVGQNFVILTGGIDLSVGSVISFISVIVVGMLSIIGTPLSILIGLSVGFIVGAINGFIVTRFKVMPFLATFCFYAIYQGLALFIDKGACRNIIELNFLKIFSSYIFGMIPVSIFYSLIIFFIGVLILSRSTFGIKIYAVGGNEEAARLSGINSGLTKLLAYAISGLLAAGASIILSATLQIGDALIGIGYELDSIAAVCIGGTLLTGGEGSVVGPLGGALIMGVIKNLLNLHGVSAFVQQIVTGVIILVAVLIATKKS